MHFLDACALRVTTDRITASRACGEALEAELLNVWVRLRQRPALLGEWRAVTICC